MRRLVVLGALLGLVMFPAQASAAAPPDPTISVSSVHYAGRGVIELDLAYSCSTPTAREYWWDPYVSVYLEQGRGMHTRSAYYEKGLGPKSCDGQMHVKVLRLTADEDGPIFRGGRVTIYAGIDACYENERTGEWFEKYSSIDGARFRVRHSG